MFQGCFNSTKLSKFQFLWIGKWCKIRKKYFKNHFTRALASCLKYIFQKYNLPVVTEQIAVFGGCRHWAQSWVEGRHLRTWAFIFCVWKKCSIPRCCFFYDLGSFCYDHKTEKNFLIWPINLERTVLCSDPNFEGFFIELHGVCVCVRVLLPLTGPPLLYAFPYDPPAYEACAQIYSVKIRAGSTLFALIRESLNCWCCWSD